MIGLLLTCLIGLLYISFAIGIQYLWSTPQSIHGYIDPVIDPIILPPVSIIIIARNESGNIIKCLSSIAANLYPLDAFEMILMDDHSDDNTVELAEGLGIENLRVLRLAEHDLTSLENKYKKAGQYYAVQECKFDHILQTDADCEVTPEWIRLMARQLETKDLITGPVHLSGKKDILSRWQTFENIGTMVFTNAGIHIDKWYSANAANMAFKKELYYNYSLNANHSGASGDDIFFIDWAQDNDYKVGYAKHPMTIVTTITESTVGEFFNQRLRWATKTRFYGFNGLKLSMVLLFMFHLMITMLGLLSLFVGSPFTLYFLVAFAAKWIGDTMILSSGAPFFGVNYPIWLSPIFSILHTFYVVGIGISGLALTDYNWKGRRVR